PRVLAGPPVPRPRPRGPLLPRRPPVVERPASAPLHRGGVRGTPTGGRRRAPRPGAARARTRLPRPSYERRPLRRDRGPRPRRRPPGGGAPGAAGRPAGAHRAGHAPA